MTLVIPDIILIAILSAMLLYSYFREFLTRRRNNQLLNTLEDAVKIIKNQGNRLELLSFPETKTLKNGEEDERS